MYGRICGGTVSPVDEGRSASSPSDLTVGGVANGCVIAISAARFPVPAYPVWSAINERFSRLIETGTDFYFAGADAPTTGGNVAATVTWTGGSVDQRGVSVAYQIT